MASASPTPMDTSTTPTPSGPVPADPPKRPVYRPRVNADPLRRPTKRERRPRPPPGAASTPPGQVTLPIVAGQSPQPGATPTPEPPKEEDMTGWSAYPLKTTKRALMEGLRFHVMRLQSKNKAVDITDTIQFTRPVRLHRRDPRAPPQGAKEEAAALAAAEDAKKLDPEEQKKLDEALAAKKAEDAATLAAIAPYGGAQRQKKNAFKKKTQQVYHTDEAAKKLRYEEYFPWHIEDFDNKNTWVGSLEGALSEGSQVILIMDGNCFRMIPVEKWYKFTQKANFKTLSIEEAEAVMKRKTKTPRWFMEMTKAEERALKEKEEAESRAAMGPRVLVKGERLKNLPKEDVAEADEVDFEDTFQDDEEAPIMDGEEEENRQIEKRIKKEQLGANFFDAKDEKEYEEEEREKKRRAQLVQKNGKKVIKYLRGHEKNLTYETDSDENPYASSAEDSSDDEAKLEEERKKAEEKKREEERKQLEAEKKKREEEEAAKKAAAGAVQASKSDDKVTKPSKKAEKHKQLKRTAQDPYQSESGTDTAARKKARKNAPTRTSTPQPPSTPVPTPSDTGAPAGAKQVVKLKVGPGSLAQVAAAKKRTRDGMSDNEFGAGAETSGGETATKKKKINIKMKDTAASSGLAPPPIGPDGKSRTASSPPSSTGVTTATRGVSPAPTSVSQASTPKPAPGASNHTVSITTDEISAVLNLKPEGQELKEFLSHFKGRVGKDNMGPFLALLRPLSKQKGKLICPK